MLLAFVCREWAPGCKERGRGFERTLYEMQQHKATIMIDGKTYSVTPGKTTIKQLITATGINPATNELRFVSSQTPRTKQEVVGAEEFTIADGDALTSQTVASSNTR
jgi:hypothetical protein